MAEKKAGTFTELANRNLNRPNGLDRLEFMPQLRGRKASELYRQMSDSDALVAGILFEIEMVLRQVDWEAQPTGTGDNGEVTDYDIERADFLWTCWTDMSHSPEQVLQNALTMLPFGFAVLETVYKKRDSADLAASSESRTRHPDGRIGWRKLSLVPADSIDDFVLDDTGGIEAVVQGGGIGSRIVLPIDKLLLFRTDTSTPRGKSILRRSVEAWYYRKRIREIEGIGIERDLAGLPVMYVEEGNLKANETDYQNLVSNLRNDEQAGVLLPAMLDENGKLTRIAELELLSTGGTRQFDTNTIIGRYNREIAMSLLQDVVLLGHEKVGTQALASEKRDLSDTALQAWLNDIAAVFNDHAIPRLFALNGESLEGLPRLVPGELHPAGLLEFTEAIKNAAGAGIPVQDEEAVRYIRQRLGLPELDPDEYAAQVEPEPAPEPPAAGGKPDPAEDEQDDAKPAS